MRCIPITYKTQNCSHTVMRLIKTVNRSISSNFFLLIFVSESSVRVLLLAALVLKLYLLNENNISD